MGKALDSSNYKITRATVMKYTSKIEINYVSYKNILRFIILFTPAERSIYSAFALYVPNV